VFRERRPTRVPDLTNDPLFHAAYEGWPDVQLGTSVYAPVALSPDTPLLGVIQAARSDGGLFDHADLMALQDLASAAAPALARGRMALRSAEARRLEDQLWTFANNAAQQDSLGNLLQTIVDSAVQMFRAERGSLFLHDAAAEELYAFVFDGEAASGGRQIRLSVNAGVAGHVFTSKEPLYLDDPKSDPRFYWAVDKLTGFETRTLDTVPLIDASGDAIGVMQLLNRGTRTWTARDRQRYELLARQAATFISHTQVVADLEATVADLRQPETTEQTTEVRTAATSTRAVLFAAIEAATGFPVASLSDGMHLLDDLNLDSIKSVAVLTEAASQLGVPLDPQSLGNISLGEAVTRLDTARTSQTVDASSARATLFRLVAELTGYPEASLSGGMRLLDDLNLDSIKSVAIGADLAAALGLSGTLPEGLGNLSLDELVTAILESATGPEAEGRAVAWVRDFVVDLVPKPLPSGHAAPPLSTRVLGDGPLADALRERLGTDGAPGRVVVAISAGSVEARLELLAALASLPGEHWADLEQLAFVARGDWGGAKAFAASIQLERADLSVRAIDFDPELPVSQATALVTAELASPASGPVHYTAASERLVPELRLLHPVEATPRSPWSSTDLVVVTGGGKGITAACARALAETSGARLALVGRSTHDPAADDELSRTLAGMTEAGVDWHYYPCDVSDRAAVFALVARVREELGDITAVIHGAGRNIPREVQTVGAEAALEEVTPKLLGARWLCEALEEAPPRLFVGFTSIIGVQGMARNAWYAFANDNLDLMLRAFASRHPQTQAMSYAFSIWADVGMGVKLGSVSHLAAQGIDAIGVTEGIEHFLRWMVASPPDAQVVVSSRLGQTPAVRRPGRFLEQVERHTPGVELVVRAQLTTERDRYVLDHDFQGSLLFPTVMGLEAMAQVVLAVTGVEAFEDVIIEDIRLDRPIVVHAQNGTAIELRAVVAEQRAAGARTVEVSVHSETTRFGPPHFAATFRLGTTPLVQTTPPAAPEVLELDPAADLYGGLLFQGPLFQRLQAVRALDGAHCIFDTEGRDQPEAGFSPEVAAPLVLGDPYTRDTLLQTMQLVVSPLIALPVHIERIELSRPASITPGPRRAEVRYEGRTDQRLRSHVEAWQGDHLVERLVGYELQVLDERDDLPTAEQLARPRHEREAAALPTVVDKPEGVEEPEASPTPAQAPPAEFDLSVMSLDTTPDGPAGQRRIRARTPVLFREASNTSGTLRYTHFFDWMGRLRELAAQPIFDAWVADFLTGRWGAVTNGSTLWVVDAAHAGETLEGSVWTEGASGPLGSTVSLCFQWDAVGSDGRRPVAYGRMRTTWVEIIGHGEAKVAPNPDYMQAFMGHMAPAANQTVSAFPPAIQAPLGASRRRIGPGQPALIEHVFQTTRQHSNIVGNVYFSNYAEWQGEVVDLLAHEAVPGATGELRIVQAGVDHLREAMPFDQVGCRLFLAAEHDQGVVLRSEFRRGDLKLAAGEVIAQWTERDDTGAWVPRPLPPGLRARLGARA
jgi:NAD(P)-dependent dehydrogenase (short-subunit alcohol dehydrogenase family)/acyl carrier protein